MSTSSSSTSPATPEASASRVAGVVARLAGVDVRVPDPESTAAFLAEGLGFAVIANGDGTADVFCDGRYAPRRQQRVMRLARGERTELAALRFDLADGLGADEAAAMLEAAGVDPGVDDGAVVLADPSGPRLELSVAESQPLAEIPPHPLRPRRLGHANLMTPDPSAAAAFYARALGMRLSEQIGEFLYFLRFDTEHHNIGLRPGPAGAHHLGFEIHGWEAYRPILDHLADLGHRVEYGPGRHGPGRNMFTYLRDPSSGLRLELFCDMAHVDEQLGEGPLVHWRAEDRMTKTLNRWGPQPPETFL